VHTTMQRTPDLTVDATALPEPCEDSDTYPMGSSPVILIQTCTQQSQSCTV
jgi:hypothetical protein